MSIKDTIAQILNLDTYEDKFRQKSYENDILASKIAKLTIENESLKADLDFYKLRDEDKLKVMRADIQGLADQYIKMIQIYQESATRCEAMIEDMEDKLKQNYSRGLSDGRAAAYGEMGIWRLDAIEAGNRLVMDAKGDVYELLELQDVKPDDTDKVEEDGIIIDDLVDVGV